MSLRIGIAGTGGIGLGSAGFLAQQGHQPMLWSPRGQGAEALKTGPLRMSGVLEGERRIPVAADAAMLAGFSDVILIAAPVNAHRAIMDSLLSFLRDGVTVIVSSMASLSALYLYEAALAAGKTIRVASFGTTTLTARRDGPASVKVLTRRTRLGVSALPVSQAVPVQELVRSLFGDVFFEDANALASALSNVNPVAHGPLALFNWTRIERAEHWPQYHYITPHVAAVIERLDGERLALARAFGLEVRSIAAHFAQSFGATKTALADIAAELHAVRNGPPGPTDTGTRFITEDVPFGLAFALALAPMAGIAMDATRVIVESASLVSGQGLASANDLIAPLGLAQETREGLLRRVAG